MATHPADRPRIVVGVDGSESSGQALRWALRQAAATDSLLEAVIACRRRCPVTAPSGLLATSRRADATLTGQRRAPYTVDRSHTQDTGRPTVHNGEKKSAP